MAGVVIKLQIKGLLKLYHKVRVRIFLYKLECLFRLSLIME